MASRFGTLQLPPSTAVRIFATRDRCWVAVAMIPRIGTFDADGLGRTRTASWEKGSGDERGLPSPRRALVRTPALWGAE